MDYVVLGKNIRKYRQMRGMRQEDLAEICDCGNSHIGQIENARGIPSLDMIVRIAKCSFCNGGSIAQRVLYRT